MCRDSEAVKVLEMNKLRKARWRNILRKAATINRLLDKGCIVFDHYENRVEKFKFKKDGKLIYQGNEKVKAVWVGEDGGMWDSALDIPIKKFNADRFDKWTKVHPKDIKKI